MQTVQEKAYKQQKKKKRYFYETDLEGITKEDNLLKMQ